MLVGALHPLHRPLYSIRLVTQAVNADIVMTDKTVDSKMARALDEASLA